jgi:hypothetical protein
VTQLELHLVYDPARYPALVARTSKPETLAAVRELLIDEAEDRLAYLRDAGDAILLATEEADVRRLRVVLDALVPEQVPA